MHQPPLPLTRDLVLVGGGHTHALVLRKWGMSPLPGARLTIVNPDPTAPYSGMLPGFVAGHYARDELDIDLVQLARFAGARVIVGAVTGLDPVNKIVQVPGRPPIAYDIASVNIGITSAMPDVQGFADHAVPAKPLGPFAARWAAYLDRTGPASVAVIGGGVAGAELVMAMAHALHRAGRVYQATLIDSARILSATADKSASVIRQSMDDLGVTVLEESYIASIGSTGITLEDGCRIEAEFVTGAAGARAYDWPAKSGLALQDGYIAVDAELRSSDPSVFAAGDCAHFSPSPRPKAGVFAVREAPVLYNNLRAALGAGKPRRYVPQKDYLKLISLGSKSALGERFGRAVSGPLMWRWKNRIDRNFMARFTNLPEMHSPVVPRTHAAGLREAIGDKPICGGCGAKLGRTTLQAGLSVTSDTPGDDAAILQTGDVAQVLTTDHLRPLTLDPVLMTRIAAIHALGDIWAMGADPQAATATIILPRLARSLQERTLAEIMTTARATFEEAGGKIVGGHSSVGDELTIGLTVTGLCASDPITLEGGQPGDALILTKPLGSGVLMAAAMSGKAKGSDIIDAYSHMTQSQNTASKILSNAHAMTDVTGFGLAGHLDGLCRLSNCGATLDLRAIPVMSGAAELARAGVRSTLFEENRDLVPDLTGGGITDLLFDPQTAGGLLAAVPAKLATDLCADLQQAGYQAAVIGALTEQMGLRVQS